MLNSASTHLNEDEEPMELEEEEEVMDEIEVEDEGEQQQQQQNEEEKSQGDNGAKAAQAQEEQAAKIITDPPLALLQSLNGLFDLNCALSEFVHQWHALHHSLDAILSSIDRRSRELDGPTEVEKGGPGDYYPPAVSSKAVDRAAELLSICESTGSRALRKFVVSNLSDLEWLRGEVPAALRRAPSPAKLVLDAMGRFYLQGRKAYDRPMDDPMVVFRRACILILEFYVLSGCSSVDPEESVKKDAQVAALSWRTRLVNEGGLQVASAVDALGLVLFLSSFGIPEEFGCTDMYNLLRLSNLKKKADVFRKSSILCEKMPDIIHDMLSKEMKVEAVNLICAFELKDKYPPLPLLVSFLQKSTLFAKDERMEGQSSLKSLREANEKLLERLKLVAKCLENYKLDPSELASFNINQKIAKIERVIAKDDERLKNKNLKRKAQDLGQIQLKNYWCSSAKPSHSIMPHFGKQYQEQQSASLANPDGYYGSLYRRNAHDDGFGLHNGLCGVSSLTAGVHTSAGVSSELVAATAEGTAGSTVENSSRPFTNYDGDLYKLHGNGALDERLVGQNFLASTHSEAWMGPSSMAGQNVYYSQASGDGYGTGSSSTNLYQFADTVLEREAYYANSSISNPPTSVPNQSYYPS
ncbi:hypothetical protein C4D60_Mb03t15130 [Musa balbisiana]|uniref:FRIGIDA-like protein n=1 Tax=Musa balbisiana TaxID=52838 RepID=A0A4S8JAE2_MUSBA|nr:hypothetical protein C4D60_Mb03t15130 [Musa balbisiana]